MRDPNAGREGLNKKDTSKSKAKPVVNELTLIIFLGSQCCLMKSAEGGLK